MQQQRSTIETYVTSNFSSHPDVCALAFPFAKSPLEVYSHLCGRRAGLFMIQGFPVSMCHVLLITLCHLPQLRPGHHCLRRSYVTAASRCPSIYNREHLVRLLDPVFLSLKPCPLWRSQMFCVRHGRCCNNSPPPPPAAAAAAR